MTAISKDALSRWAELVTKYGISTVLLVVVLYCIRVDVILPLMETQRQMTSAMQSQTELLKEIRDEQRRGR